MSDAADVRVLIVAQPESARRWALALAADGATVWASRAQMPAQARPEVLLTDAPALPGAAADAAAEPGVVRVGAEGPADALLPADAAAREICLACHLVARIARLRGQVRSSLEIHEQLFRQALSDPLTGLPNRRAWEEWFPARLAAPRAPEARLCLAIIDLDHFKRVNDERGHAAGDEVLRAAAKSLREGLRQEDLLARLGGDEFGLLVEVHSPEAAAGVVDRVRRRVATAPDAEAGRRVTASAGYCLLPAPEAADPLAAADAALREAKRQGRDQTRGFVQPD